MFFFDVGYGSVRLNPRTERSRDWNCEDL
jgi:hypothetical protein